MSETLRDRNPDPPDDGLHDCPVCYGEGCELCHGQGMVSQQELDYYWRDMDEEAAIERRIQEG